MTPLMGECLLPVGIEEGKQIRNPYFERLNFLFYPPLK